MRILINDGFYGLLLMNMLFSLDESVETAVTNGKRIYFAPEFLDKLCDSELDFVMMHEILHIALKHVFRGKNYDPEIFNEACDIVVNSNIMKSKNGDVSFITLSEFGESMHLTPDGKEGWEFTAEEVYAMLASAKKREANRGKTRVKAREIGSEKTGNSTITRAGAP